VEQRTAAEPPELLSPAEVAPVDACAGKVSRPATGSLQVLPQRPLRPANMMHCLAGVWHMHWPMPIRDARRLFLDWLQLFLIMVGSLVMAAHNNSFFRFI
jgi:hypothetical protein